MIRIITAIGNSELNDELKKYQDFNVLNTDIQYVDGIFEVLEVNKDIDYLVLSESIDGKYEIEYLIHKIYSLNRNIKIVFVLNDKNPELENQLIKIGIYDFFYSWNDLIEIINFLKNKNIENINMQLRNEIDELKKIIYKKSNNHFIQNKNEHFIIEINGMIGAGKTTFSYLLASGLKNKVLLIDFDLTNGSLSKLVDSKKVDYDNFENMICSYNNIDILVNLHILKKMNLLNIENLRLFINEIKKNYDYILIDSSEEEIYFDNSDKILFLFEIDKINFNKIKNKLNIYLNKYNNKLIFIINKYNFISYFFQKNEIKKFKINNKKIIKIKKIFLFNLIFSLRASSYFKKVFNIIIKKNKIIKNIIKNNF